MQKSEAAATLMLKNSKGLEYLLNDEPDFSSWRGISPAAPFDEAVLAFLNSLSQKIAKMPAVRNFPDVATFGFFCRKANLLQLKKQFLQEQEVRQGRGIVFHIAPSNVAVNFAYSMLAGMLAGNHNIIRVPSLPFEQVTLIAAAIREVMSESGDQTLPQLSLVRYDRSNAATAEFSALCDLRVIWGGDETIRQIRRNELPARAFDITFADRYSFCMINADAYINEPAPEKIAQGFYNDTYLFDQNACTAPHLVIWTGERKNIESAQTSFWARLHEILIARYQVQPVIAVDKISTFFRQASELKNIRQIQTGDNLIWRVELQQLPENIEEYRCTSGYFSEYIAENPLECSHIINRKFQTLAYYGYNKEFLRQMIESLRPNGIDRVVPIGRTSDFSLLWDGFDLINSMSRRIEIN